MLQRSDSKGRKYRRKATCAVKIFFGIRNDNRYALARRRASLASDAKQENEFLCVRSLLSSTMIGRSKFLEIMDTQHVNTLPGPELPRSRTTSA